MSKFKKGDVAITTHTQVYTEGRNNSAILPVGYIGVVTDVGVSGTISVDNKLGADARPCFNPYAFELYSEFNLLKDSWFIRFSNEAEFYLAREFVKNNGLEFKYEEDFDYTLPYVAVALDPHGSGEVIRMLEEDLLELKGFEEIKLKFKVEIDSVEWPGTIAQKMLDALDSENENE